MTQKELESTIRTVDTITACAVFAWLDVEEARLEQGSRYLERLLPDEADWSAEDRERAEEVYRTHERIRGYVRRQIYAIAPDLTVRQLEALLDYHCEHISLCKQFVRAEINTRFEMFGEA